MHGATQEGGKVDKKLRLNLGRILDNAHWGEPVGIRERVRKDTLCDIEQAFLDAGYVVLPSENELSDMLKAIDACKYDTFRKDAKELLKLLKGEQP